MRETMVRTQVYLPRDVYQRLQKRAAESRLTLAVQIREALEDYLRHVETEDEEVLMSPDDPLRALVGSVATGLGHGSVNHDQYIYVRDWDDPHPTIHTQRSVRAAVKEPKAKDKTRRASQGRRPK